MFSEKESLALELLVRFAHRTGLESDGPQRRYLWTDAFAVTTLAGLGHSHGDARCAELATSLVHAVHHRLGRHREDDSRSGWISGLSEEDGEAHPTAGGLRIGKPLPERGPRDRFDADLEWERDGQYFHYLTKWMHALDQLARIEENATLHRWARELADRAHRAFAYGPPAQRRMFWKVSVDLSRPLVPSMGQHDPLDGLVTCIALDATAIDLGASRTPSLADAQSDFASMIDPSELVTSDPLGIGGLLFDACRLAQIDARAPLVAPILRAARYGLARVRAGRSLARPAHERLAFRELGLAIGIAATTMLANEISPRLDAPARDALGGIVDLASVREEIESFWLERTHRRTSSWRGHEDINDVMLATSLAPAGFVLRPPVRSRRSATR